jgi:hypothetical protein
VGCDVARSNSQHASTIIVVATRQSSGTRAKDTDRNDTCQVLDTALSEGQLSMEEHRERVSTATQAATLGDLQALVSDLQTENAPVQLPKLRIRTPFSSVSGNGRGMRVAVASVLVLFGVGLGWGIFGHSSPLHSGDAANSDPGEKPDGIEPVVLTPPTQLFSLNGLTGLMEQTRKKFGDTMGYSLRIFSDDADLDRADPKEPRRKLSYTYRGGWASQSSGSKSDSDVLVDLGGFDPATLVAVLRGAPKSLGIKPQDVKSSHIEIKASPDPLTPAAVVISIYVSGEFSSGWMSVDGAGNVVQMYPATP